MIIGEACHFIDFCHWLVEASPVEVSVAALGGADKGVISEDNVHMTLTFADGSLATVAYLSNGSKAYSRERIEVFCENSSAVLADFRSLERVHDLGMVKRDRTRFRQDKGYVDAVSHFLDSVRTKNKDNVFASQLLSMRMTIRAAEAARALLNPASAETSVELGEQET